MRHDRDVDHVVLRTAEHGRRAVAVPHRAEARDAFCCEGGDDFVDEGVRDVVPVFGAPGGAVELHDAAFSTFVVHVEKDDAR